MSNFGNGKIIIVVGDFGAGKTTMLKTQFLKPSKKEKLIYALIKKDLGDYPYERDFKEYINIGVTKANTLFVIDEASTAIPNKQPEPSKKDFDNKLITWFLNARKCNNYIFIVYHTLREIPIWLISYSDYFLRFRTNDLLQHQRNRFISFPNVVKSIDTIPTMKNFEYDEIKVRD